MKLIEVDSFDAESAERRFALLSDRVGPEHPLRLLHWVARVPHQPALREHERPFVGRQLPQQTPDQLLGMAETVHRGGIDPGDAQLDRVTHRGE
jgi:hypothetical protein